LGVHTISSRALSASQASLRIFYDKLAKNLTNPVSVIPDLTRNPAFSIFFVLSAFPPARE
ncbi:MAG: hypothetical protein WCJ37_16190, partial [Syntrophus sp. (in: bacteria)]